MCIGEKEYWVDRKLQGSGGMVMVENGFRDLDRILRMNKTTKKHNQPPSQQGEQSSYGGAQSLQSDFSFFQFHLLCIYLLKKLLG